MYSIHKNYHDWYNWAGTINQNVPIITGDSPGFVNGPANNYMLIETSAALDKSSTFTATAINSGQIPKLMYACINRISIEILHALAWTWERLGMEVEDFQIPYCSFYQQFFLASEK